MIECIKGDITRMNVDAIVNAANSMLTGGAGVNGAIQRAGGPQILQACQEIAEKEGGCPTGGAVITTAGNLPASYVIHAVGPVWQGGNEHEDDLLASTYRSSLQLALEHQLNTIAFPNISTGIYGFPRERAAHIAIRTVQEFLQQNGKPQRVIFVCYDAENFDLYTRLLQHT